MIFQVQASLEGISKVNESLGALGNILMSIQGFVSKHTEWAESFLADNNGKVPCANRQGGAFRASQLKIHLINVERSTYSEQ